MSHACFEKILQNCIDHFHDHNLSNRASDLVVRVDIKMHPIKTDKHLIACSTQLSNKKYLQ